MKWELKECETELTKSEYRSNNASYLEDKKITDARLEIQDRVFNANDSSTFSDEDDSPGNAELIGGFSEEVDKLHVTIR